MKTILLTNMLLEFITPSQESHIERILWIEPSGANIVLIDVANPKALPIIRKVKAILDGLDDTSIRIIEEEPFGFTPQENEIPDHWKKRRDTAWELIEPLIANHCINIFVPSQRGQIIALHHQQTERRKATIYLYLRRYWQGGQVKNALLPHWDQCGSPGKPRQDRGKKRGRPNRLSQTNPQKAGTNIEEAMKAKIQIGGKTFFEVQKLTLKDAWRSTLKRFFMKTEIINNRLEHKLFEKYPSYSQFQYWYYKLRDYEKSLIRREGERNFALNFRALKGRSTDLSFGPGSVFQIDATIGDLYLVSIFDRTIIIGKPVVYLVVDVFSYIIAGLYVTIDTMCKTSAMMALENTFTDKVGFCQKYGIEISEDEWGCHHMPEILLADRAELRGYYGDDLVNFSRINIANTASYRADMKGLVEHCFNLLNIRAIHTVPGATPGPRLRCERDPKLDATLNIYEFTQLLINTILFLNRRRLSNYPVDGDLIQQHVDPRPINLWNWGVEHRNGSLRTDDPLKVRKNLLPRDEATVTERGIRYKKDCYTAPEIEHWFSKARKDGTWGVEISYHPRITNQIYLVSPNRKESVVLTKVADPSDEIFHNATFEDIDAYIEERKINEANATPLELEQWANYKAKNEMIVGNAKEEKNDQEKLKGSKSKREKSANIRENRKKEQESLRIKEISSFTKGEPNTEIPVREMANYISPVIDFRKWKLRKGEE